MGISIDPICEGLLYIGPIQAAYLWDELDKLGIKGIVDLSGSKYERNPWQNYLCLSVEDSEEADILPAIQRALPFISEHKARKEAVLVHCVAGKSRSATICAAWLMVTKGLTATMAIDEVRARHARTDPNKGF